MAAMGVASDQLIDDGLFAEPVPWSNVELATLPELYFDLQRVTSRDAGTRPGSAGVQWKGRIPRANVRSVTDAGRPSIP